MENEQGFKLSFSTVVSYVPKVVSFVEICAQMAKDLKDAYLEKKLQAGQSQAEASGDTSGVDNAFKQSGPHA